MGWEWACGSVARSWTPTADACGPRPAFRTARRFISRCALHRRLRRAHDVRLQQALDANRKLAQPSSHRMMDGIGDRRLQIAPTAFAILASRAGEFAISC